MALPRFQLSPAVQKALTERNLTADEVIRKALNVRPEGLDAGEGVVFAEGTNFLAWYKDRPYWGVVKDGNLVVDGHSFSSVSGAAAKITGRPTTNGWSFWMVKIPNKNEFVPIMQLRKDKETKK